MPKRWSRLLPAVAAGMWLLWLPTIASAVPPPIGGLTQIPAPSGCFANTATGSSCQVGAGIFHAESAVVSPDGRFVYVGSQQFNGDTAGLAAFARNPATGVLTQLPGTAGCYTRDGSSQAGPNTCTAVEGLGAGDGNDFVITSDGRWAYMVNQGPTFVNGAPPASIVIFQRDPATGILTQPAAPNGCISSNGNSQNGAKCQTLSTLGVPDGISLSPDDRFVYVTDLGANTIQVLARDATTGALNPVQCLSDNPSPPAGCEPGGRSLGEVQALAASPDGTHAYAADFNHGISIFDINADGTLTQLGGAAGCISDDGTDNAGNPTCATGRVLNGAFALRVSPDGQTLYVMTQNDSGVAVFHVNPDGTLTQLAGTAGCVTLTGKDQNGAPSCAVGRALVAPIGEAISPDGHFLYVADMADDPTAGGIAIFSIDPATGALTQLPGVAGCITVDGTSAGVPGACTVGGSTFAQPQSVSVSPDGLSVYLPSFAGESLTTLTRETGPVCQGTTASTAYQTPVTVTLSCTDADGDAVTLALASGPTHGSLGPIGPTVTYTPAAGFSGVDSFTFIASDATNASAPTTATIAVGSPPSSLPPSNSRPANVSGVHQTHRTWREGNRLAKISAKRKRPPVGTTFSFTLNETANVTFAFTQRAAGRRVHDRCIAATKLGAKGRKCTRTLIGGTISFIGHPGRNKVAFDGRVNRHRRLKPGTYTLIITAAAPGGHSQPQRITFTIVR